MNFNAQSGPDGRAHRSLSKKPKRVSDVNAMGSSIPYPQMTSQIPSNQYMANDPQMPQYMSNDPNDFYGQQHLPQAQPAYGYIPPQPQQPQMNIPRQPNQPLVPEMGGGAQQFAMFQQPIVQDMAMQYGQKLADHGKEIVHSQIEKYLPTSKLKYYFAVDNRYVINKLKIVFFPFLHNDWSMKYDHENPVQPRCDINAPDLYIPAMSFITYVVLAGIALGVQKRFSSEQLGIQASSALAYSIFEMVIYTLTLYVGNISTSISTFDLLALTGYKYTAIVSIVAASILLKRMGYYIALIYSSAMLALFLLRTMKAKVLAEPTHAAASVGYEPYGQQQNDHQAGRKRKLYFLFMVTGLQPVLAFWLTVHLIVADTVPSA
ncbi:protein YIF1B-A [Anopheles bellator]|uniref:protein YIF1B-A n=1 Tax=Anopheles bellator TaxID=139047 RepID=UPI002649E9B3|nr:protein YIF1B-A [Anopheles bellator]